jgi:hypothetical protein
MGRIHTHGFVVRVKLPRTLVMKHFSIGPGVFSSGLISCTVQDTATITPVYFDSRGPHCDTQRAEYQKSHMALAGRDYGD